LINRSAPCLCNAGSLYVSVRGTDVWIQARRGSRYGVSSDRCLGREHQRCLLIVKVLDQLGVIKVPLAIFELTQGQGRFIRDIVVEAVMHHTKANPVEVYDLVLLVISFGRSMEELGARRSEIRT